MSVPMWARGYHNRWGKSGLFTPVKILHSFVTVLVRCAEPWKPPTHSKFNLARGMFVREIARSDFFGPSILVDAAWDKFGYRVEAGCKVLGGAEPSRQSTGGRAPGCGVGGTAG